MYNINWKRYWLTVLAVIIVRAAIAFLLFAVVFSEVFEQQLPGGRPEGEELHLAGMISMIAWAFGFTYIFIRGYENKGWMEGIRFGLVVWAFYFIPMLTGYWAYFELPANWIVAGVVTGLAESLAAGVIASLVYKPKMK